MLLKPPECEGCPAYGDGQGFVPDNMKEGTEICLIAQGPGSDEEAGRRYLGNETWEPHSCVPLIGKTGRVWERGYLPLAGLDRSEVSTGNIIRCRWNHKDKLPPINQKVVQQAIKHCNRAHFRPPASTKVFVAMGEYAFLGLTSLQHDFNGWRGYVHPYRPLHAETVPPLPTRVWTPGQVPGDPLPVYVVHHIARIFREPEAELPAKRDWNKLAQLLAGKWPEPMPPIETNPEKLVWAPGSAFDTEFIPETGQLIRFSVANPDRQVFVIEWADMIQYRHDSTKILQRVLPETTQIVPVYPMWPTPDTQCHSSGLVSRLLPEGLRGMGQAAQGQTSVQSYAEVPESVVSSLLQTDASKTRVHPTFSLHRTHPYTIPGYGTLPIEALSNLPETGRSRTRPLPSDWPSAGPALLTVQPGHWAARGSDSDPGPSECIPLKLVAHHAAVDIPYLSVLLPNGTVIDVDCSMMAHACLWTGRVETDDQKGKQGGASSHTLNFLGSIYARINRWKHLARIAPRQYSGADALGTMDAWATGLHGGLSGELARDPQTKWVYENLQKPLVPIVLRAHKRGIATDQKAAQVALRAIREEQQAFEMRAQAYAGWPLNLRSPAHVAFWIYTIEQVKARRKFGAR